MTSTLLPQYITQYKEPSAPHSPGDYTRLLEPPVQEYHQPDFHHLPPTEVITFPSIPNGGGGGTGNGFQSNDKAPLERMNSYQKNLSSQPIYPPLTPSLKGTGGYPSSGDNNVNSKTPLLTKKKIVPTKTNFWGILLAFISGVFFTLCSGTVKYLTDIDPMMLLIFRSLFQVAVTLPIALSRNEHLMGPSGSRLLLFFQGIIGGTTLVMLFYSFRLLPLGDAATIIFSSPVFVMVMSHLWLREPCGFYRTLIVFMLVTGVVFITKPPFLFTREVVEGAESAYNMVGYAAALSGTIFTAMNIVIMRKCNKCHYSVVVFQFSFWSLVISSLILAVTSGGVWPQMPVMELTQWVLVLLVGVFGLSGQILVAIALTYEGAGRVAVTRSMDIVLAYVLQVIIFNEVPDWRSVMGASMVMVCVVGMGIEDIVHKWMNNLP